MLYKCRSVFFVPNSVCVLFILLISLYSVSFLAKHILISLVISFLSLLFISLKPVPNFIIFLASTFQIYFVLLFLVS